MCVAMRSDDLWLGVICQSNQVIAGSPRNAFTCSLATRTEGVEILEGMPSPQGYRFLPNSEYLRLLCRSEQAGASSVVRKGNSPDHRLRSLSWI